MLYLVSGASRSGKTIIGKKILEERGIAYLSLDWIVMGFTNGMPQCGIHDKLFPDEIARKLQKFLEAMCESMLWTEEEYVIEGEAIEPETARVLLNRHPGKVTACFLGYAHVEVNRKIQEVKAHSKGVRDWLLNESDEFIVDHIQNMVQHSRNVEQQCANHRLSYFDTSSDFVNVVNQATQYLLTAT